MITKTKAAYEKLKCKYAKHWEKITYVFFGGCTTAVALGVGLLCDIYNVEITITQIISWICAVTFAFVVNKKFVFQSVSENRKGVLKEAVSFYVARLATLGLDLGFMIVMVEYLHQERWLMRLFSQVFIFIGNYFISKFLVFRKK